MSKTESTAVNELIELVTTQKPLAADPSEDLMFRAPAKKVSAPRMTSTVPAIHGAGEVAPLPRTRAPQGTQRQVPVVGGAPPIPPVRVSTAPMSRTLTIPPIGPKQLAEHAPVEPPDSMVATTPNLGAQLRQSSPRTTMMGTSAPPAIPAAAAPPPLPHARATTAPPLMPVAAPFESKPALAPTVPYAGAPMALPVYPPAQPYRQHSHDMTGNQEWFDQDSLANDGVEQEIGTARIPKGSDWKAIIPKLIVPMIGLVIIGVFVGGFFAFNGDGGRKPRTAPVTTTEVASAAAAPANVAAPAKAEPAQAEPAAAEPAATETPTAANVEPAKAEPATAEPAPANDPEVAKVEPATPVVAKAEPATPVVAKAEPAKAEPAKAAPAPVTPPNLASTAGTPAKTESVVVPARPTLVDIRIDSKPSGATVMLVDRGKTTFLGTTPISTAVDGSRKYDLVFTYANKPTQLEHLDPSTTKRVAVTLGKSSRARAAKPELTKLEKTERPAKVTTVEAPRAEKAVVDPFVEKKPEPAGEGVLMISSKPPCEIFVDGVATGLTTPQRAIKLTAGKHKITLVNATEKIKKTIAVQITADQPTKVIQDLMK